ncbi:4'-phosphopantetheinyl transferase family protein [Kibdelosporangium aridum]|uniref:4'-phosphopantetheinyl transferase EntD (Siderophore biosynthesis) n=1 Tax=Kibdelosporangium aridum TaxID=2030 RepID=A0A1W2FC46_KIBAR|nr:4'-phosphopantetheinyl transferase superfamily protein [Kibdelosporangium aridum]SMD19487.1 4'-phosphopantetheinyl transferase EntD (siderophore biosynthesis) [Kibdelosporangium aridum]
MIEKLMPAGVASKEMFSDAAESTMFPEEAAHVAKAVDKRKREYATVRHCARQAFAELGVPPVPLLTGERGAPQWPSGIVGSMTHCAGYRAAVVARSSDIHTLGIDAEPHAPLPEGVLGVISRDEENGRLAKLTAADNTVHWDRMLFCAKETVYKAWFPLTRKWLGFEEASITLADDGTFKAKLMVPGPVIAGERVDVFNGKWIVGDGLVITAIAIPVG